MRFVNGVKILSHFGFLGAAEAWLGHICIQVGVILLLFWLTSSKALSGYLL